MSIILFVEFNSINDINLCHITIIALSQNVEFGRGKNLQIRRGALAQSNIFYLIYNFFLRKKYYLIIQYIVEIRTQIYRRNSEVDKVSSSRSSSPASLLPARRPVVV